MQPPQRRGRIAWHMQAAEHFINFSVRYVTELGLPVRDRKNVESVLSAGTQILIPDRATHPEEWEGVAKDCIPIRVLGESEPYRAVIDNFWVNTSDEAATNSHNS